MSDYGMKVTRNGVDINDAGINLNDYIFHSEYPQLNVYSYSSFSNTFIGGGSYDTFTITHNLGYVPFVLVYMQNYDGINDVVTSEYYQLDWSTSGATYINKAEAQVDSSDLTILFYDTNSPSFVNLDGFYYIFHNPAT